MPSVGDVDAVVMRDFIKHPVEPFIDIQAGYRILKPGRLLVLLMPNGEESGINIGSVREWVGFRVDLEYLHYL